MRRQGRERETGREGKGNLPFLGQQAVRLSEPGLWGCALRELAQREVEKTGSIFDLI